MAFYLYQMTKKRSEKRARLTPILIIGAIGFVIFSAYYITSIKVNLTKKDIENRLQRLSSLKINYFKGGDNKCPIIFNPGEIYLYIMF